MLLMELITLVWLTVLTVSIFALYGAVQTKWASLRSRLDDLELAEQLHRIIHRLDNETVRRNTELRNALDHAVAYIESNAHLTDKYWHELRAIKELLK